MFQAGDRILCRNNQQRLGVLNGDLATVTSVDQETESLTVRLDRGQGARELPAWYLGQGHVDYGYAMTGHKAQGATAHEGKRLWPVLIHNGLEPCGNFTDGLVP